MYNYYEFKMEQELVTAIEDMMSDRNQVLITKVLNNNYYRAYTDGATGHIASISAHGQTSPNWQDKFTIFNGGIIDILAVNNAISNKWLTNFKYLL